MGYANFDPNMNLSGNASIKTVRMTFGVWDYRLTVERETKGNMKGHQAIECAISNYWEEVMDTGIEMRKEDGSDTLLCEDDEHEGEDFLLNMLISAEILSMKPADPIWTMKHGVITFADQTKPAP